MSSLIHAWSQALGPGPNSAQAKDLRPTHVLAQGPGPGPSGPWGLMYDPW